MPAHIWPRSLFLDKERERVWASLRFTKEFSPRRLNWTLLGPPRGAIFHRGIATLLTNRGEMEHLALPRAVVKMDSSLCACICGSWQGLPRPPLQGHGFNLWSPELTLSLILFLFSLSAHRPTPPLHHLYLSLTHTYTRGVVLWPHKDPIQLWFFTEQFSASWNCNFHHSLIQNCFKKYIKCTRETVYTKIK